MRQFYDRLIKYRRALHQIPEIGFLEYQTTKYIYDALKAYPLVLHIGSEVMKRDARWGVPDSQEIAEYEQKLASISFADCWLKKMQNGMTGLIATVDTTRKGLHRAYRFDIDALPIEEATKLDHLPVKRQFRSQHDSWMHACGHDGHTAMGLVFAQYVADHLHKLNGRFTFIFQPAEEGARGAKSIVDNGWLDDVDLFFTCHLGLSDLPVGTVAVAAEGFLASTKMDIVFLGNQAHAAMNPQDGRNALVAAANAIVNSYAISRHASGASRINIGTIQGGEGRNIIPAHVHLQAEVRGENEDVHQYLVTRLREVCLGAAQMEGCTFQFDRQGVSGGVYNDEILVDRMMKHVHPTQFLRHIQKYVQVSGSEDASLMMNRVRERGGQAVYSIIGADIRNGHHHPAFDFDEAALKVGLDYFIQTLNV